MNAKLILYFCFNIWVVKEYYAHSRNQTDNYRIKPLFVWYGSFNNILHTETTSFVKSALYKTTEKGSSPPIWGILFFNKIFGGLGLKK